VLDYIPADTPSTGRGCVPEAHGGRSPALRDCSRGYWCDVGSRESYMDVHRDILDGRSHTFVPGRACSRGPLVSEAPDRWHRDIVTGRDRPKRDACAADAVIATTWSSRHCVSVKALSETRGPREHARLERRCATGRRRMSRWTSMLALAAPDVTPVRLGCNPERAVTVLHELRNTSADQSKGRVAGM